MLHIISLWKSQTNESLNKLHSIICQILNSNTLWPFIKKVQQNHIPFW